MSVLTTHSPDDSAVVRGSGTDLLTRAVDLELTRPGRTGLTPCAARPSTDFVHPEGRCGCFFGGPAPVLAPRTLAAS